jgi:arylsulfatase
MQSSSEKESHAPPLVENNKHPIINKRTRATHQTKPKLPQSQSQAPNKQNQDKPNNILANSSNAESGFSSAAQAKQLRRKAKQDRRKAKQDRRKDLNQVATKSDNPQLLPPNSQQEVRSDKPKPKLLQPNTLPQESQRQQIPDTKQKKEKKPLNILLLYADDWRYDTLGAAGNKVVQTPVLDQLAREGMRFTHNCVTTSVCWISRATLFSGMYMSRHGTTLPAQWYQPQNETLFALLQKAGYYTGHVGKLGIWQPGFQKGYIDGHMSSDEAWHDNRTFGGVHGKTKKWYITEKNEFDAFRFLSKRNKKKPFFLHLGFYATHAVDNDPRQYIPQPNSSHLYQNISIPVPFTSREESWHKMQPMIGDRSASRIRYRDRYDTTDKFQHMMKNYYRMATEVDTTCGRILQKLEEEGELDNTLVIFTTDNGNFHAEHGLADKWYPHQESIRVPLIIKDPRMPSSKVGTLNSDFTLNIDLTPTILGAAGLQALPRMMGRDMSVLYRDDVPDDDHEDINAGYGTARTKNKAHVPISKFPWRTEFFYEHPFISSESYIPSSEALVRKDIKYIFWPKSGIEQLFDLRKDPLEDNDLIREAIKMTNDTDPVNVLPILKKMRKRFQELKKLVRFDNYSIVTL